MSKLIGKDGFEILSFADKQSMYDWFSQNAERYPGVWLRMYKKASGVRSVVWAEAVDVCLCYGWIDGVANKYDEESYLQRLTPRRSKSVWSKINRANCERLIAEGSMRPSGMAQIAAAKSDGRWERAYDSPKTMTIPEDFMNELRKHPKAVVMFESLKKSALYYIGYSITTAKKPETKQRRTKDIIKKLGEGKIPG